MPGLPAPAATKLTIRLALSALPLLLLALNATGTWRLELVDRVESYLYDLRVRLSMPGGVDPRIVIIDIDERSLGVEGQWPWPRDRLARLVDRLFDDYGISVLGFDVVFPEPNEPSALAVLDELAAGPLGADPELAAALADLRERYQADRTFAEALIARDIVLGVLFKQVIAPGEPAEVGSLPRPVALSGEDVSAVRWFEPAGYTGNLPQLAANALAAGYFDTPLIDEDGKVRRIPLYQRYQGGLYESLALAVTRIAAGDPPLELAFARRQGRFSRLEYLLLGDRRIPVDAEGAVLVPFRGGVGSFPYLSATDVLAGNVSAGRLAGRIALVGTSAPGLVDIRPTPVAKQYVGVEAHANLVAGLLDGAIRHRPAWTPRVELAKLGLLALLTALWLPRCSPLGALAWIGAAAAAVVGLNGLAWQLGLWLPLAGPLTLLVLAALLQLSFGYFVETRRKRRLSRLFGQYVPPEVVEELDRSEAEVSLEGENRDMSVLFSDVRGFTTISEGLAPRELTRLMNDFLTPITAIIQGHRGTIDKYMGDAVMAFWGAPLPDPAHATQAVRAALAMVDRMASLATEFEARGWPALSIGVGVSSGPMNVGNMGSEFRMAYTVLGDTVNLGSRLEGLTKQYGVQVIVSAGTQAAAQGMVFRELDRVRVKGKREPVAIFEPLGSVEQVTEQARAAALRLAEALAAYRAGDWDRAESLLCALDAAGPHRLYQLYLQRIRHFRSAPPPADWDGVFVFETK